MTYAQMILPEYDQEMASTRSLLECIPDDKWDWKAHPNLNTIGWVANHLAEIPSWVEGTLTQTEWDFAPVGGERYQSPNFKKHADLVKFFDEQVAIGRKAIEAVKDDQMNVMWSLLDGGKPMMTMPRSAVIRGFVLNHLIHHRAHLCVYLRMNNITIPGMYGPTGP